MKTKVQFVHDTNPNTPCEILMYTYCGMCLDELPYGMSPKDYAHTQTGWTEKGFQIWCNRHEVNITNVVVKPKPPEKRPRQRQSQKDA